ncbi:MAG: hypothetical protein PUJ55_10625 [Clostridiales bacterium]|nr:hypothetical protein [Roseburia sp.]MDD7637375.1 hypothetical protein [Clostridiales bacterium]MDY4113881.1 hypothetical protein [Roseburia sp.]
MKKYNLSEIMKRAWELKKQFEVPFKEALKRSWEIAKEAVKKAEKKVSEIRIENLSIKDWFLNKNFTQNERYAIKMAEENNEITAVKQTEKALLLKANSEYGMLTFWAPKSVCIY